MPKHTHESLLLSPDAGAPGGGGGEPGAAASPAPAAEVNAGNTGGVQGAGASTGAAPAPAIGQAPEGEADGLKAAIEKARSAATETDAPAAEADSDIVSDEDLAAAEASLAGANPAAAPATTLAPAVEAPAAPVAAAPAAPKAPEARAAPTAPVAAAEYKLSDAAKARIEAIKKQLPEEDAGVFVQQVEAQDRDSFDQKQTITALQARLDKLDADRKTETERAAKQAKEEEHFTQVVQPRMRSIDAIPGLNVERYGKSHGQLTADMLEQRAVIEAKAVKLYPALKLQNPRITDAAVWEAAHRSLEKEEQTKQSQAPTTRAAVFAEARQQSKTRSPAGLSSGPARGGKGGDLYHEDDDGPTAIGKVRAAYGITGRR